MDKPRYVYDFSKSSENLDVSRSRTRLIEHEGRKGIHVMDLHGTLTLPEHTGRLSKGSVALWVLFTDDLCGRITLPHHRMNNPVPEIYSILSDRIGMPDPATANFSLYYSASGGPQLISKYFPGVWHEGLTAADPQALSWCEFLPFERLQWYHIVVTWNHERSEYEIHINGIHAGTHDHSLKGSRQHHRCGPSLYIGNPSIVYSQVEFYDEVLSNEQAAELFLEQGGNSESECTRQLSRRTTGEQQAAFEFNLDESWKQALNLPLNNPSEIENFIVQGNLGAIDITPDGLEIKTNSWSENVSMGVDSERFRQIQSYLWTREVFEGDLYVRFEFQTLNQMGLALLLTQAAGMQGEDFQRCHSPRTSGKMETVFGEDVRNYHWEFYREMYDTRCDRASHYVCKNPWHWLAEYQMGTEPWTPERWYCLEYVQIGGCVRGAIDGVTAFTFEDRSDVNMGPVLLNGRIGLRCMVRTHMRFRNLEVYNRPHFNSLDLREYR